ncbi:hypothetical protein LSTR_LSTR012060 [Laodelphax striatellus]|uniref:Par3/HAL N-terminal domain-containing protein n=1 Tax=Laodelphax striatellus TaxID=195883 RepID=A0A482WR77_LAOST|nr:hypothetical protein LSTR_LSTR012060 [Laodelphax striatellus]
MKVSVRIHSEWIQIPCKEGATVSFLGEEAIGRYQRLRNFEFHGDKIQDIRRARGGVVLDPLDLVADVLDDNDFITVSLSSDVEKMPIIPEELKFLLDPLPNSFQPSDEFIFLDGSSLFIEDVHKLGKGAYKIKLTREAEENIMKSRALIEKILNENKVVYGITTGFGNFARTNIEKSKLEELQCNLIRSHAAGVGKPLSPERTRMLLALRINVLAKGYFNRSLQTMSKLIDAFNASCLSYVPEQGSVGASGDLAPLSHLALGLMGEGKMWSPSTGWGDATEVLAANGLTPMTLLAKEGICLINGTQLITSLGAEAVDRAETIARQADVIAALTLEVLKGTSRAFDSDIVFAERGEIISAGNFHGEYPAKALDYLAIGVHELASMSERRIERLVNPALSELPAFLVKDGGLNSGFMLAHCTAASLVSENKVLCHPSSVDSISTSAAQEDHVSMGCFAARKALQVVENVEHVLAIELLAACQAIEFLRPLKTTVPLEEVYNTVRSVVRPLDKDRFMSPDIESATKLLRENKIWSAVRHHIDYYHEPLELETRVFSPTAVMVGENQREPPKTSPQGSSKRKRNDSVNE